MTWLPGLLAAGPEETALRFRGLPPLWVLIMVVAPLVVAFVWWTYRREGATAPARAKRILGTLRGLAIVLVLLLLFEPYAETSVKRLVKSHLVVLVDASASMEFVDTYTDPEKSAKTAEVAGLEDGSPSDVPRIDRVKGALENSRLGLLDDLDEKFHLHLYTFSSETVLLADAAEERPEGEAAGDRVGEIRATGAWTFLGNAVTEVLEEFRLRDEPLAGIVVVTDGRQNGGTIGPLAAARRAGEAQPRVPVYLVGVGDPDLPRNIHVASLGAKDVVLRGDDVSFGFSVSHKGFEGEVVTARMEVLGDDGRPTEELDLTGADIVLGPEDEEQTVRVSRRFDREGLYTLRIGIPVRRGEKIESDNYLIHHLLVVDKKIKVLYVDGYPRWEYRFLKDGLIRDTETVLAHVLNLDADPQVVQPFTKVPGWRPIHRFPRKREELFEYDVVIFGDVDWRRLADDDEDAAMGILENLKAFVDEGGGFVMIAGPYDSPRAYRNTPIRDVLPVVLEQDGEASAPLDPTVAFNLDLTRDGERHPIMQIEETPELSVKLWEQAPFTRQFWYYPVQKAKLPADVLAVHSGAKHRNSYGPRVLIATMEYGKGRTLFLAVDELWRLRWSFGSKYHYRFYGEAIRLLATYKLLVGNRRFKIFTEDRYFVGDPVTITASVMDRDFKPATEETQTITIQSPDGKEQDLELRLREDQPGRYERTINVYQEGSYRLTAEVEDSDEPRPKKMFKVEYSTEEMKNPLIDIETLDGMARESGGASLPLYRAGELPGMIPARSVYVSSEVRSEDLWDDLWVLFAFAGLLAAEWMLRKRYRLL